MSAVCGDVALCRPALRVLVAVLLAGCGFEPVTELRRGTDAGEFEPVISDAGIASVDAGGLEDAGSQPVFDGGLDTDAGTAADAGTELAIDAGVGRDAGSDLDAGSGSDAGIISDAGTNPDAGATDPDAGATDPDAGPAIDAGLSLDAGTPGDAGAEDAGPTWLDVSSTVAPGPLQEFALAYDTERHRTVLFGGFVESGNTRIAHDETWEWDGLTWAQRFPSVSPPARSGAAMAYDSKRKRMVLCGGSAAAGGFTDTWSWDGSVWVELTPTAPLTQHVWPALTYDSARDRIVLYDSRARNETWEFDGATWLRRFPVTSPPFGVLGPIGNPITYDEQRGVTVYVAGAGFSMSSELVTWEWDGVNWAQRTPSTSPPTRLGLAMAYDSKRHRVVLFGGVVLPSLQMFADTWAWDGNQWRQVPVPSAPTPRRSAAMAYDVLRDRFVLVDGVDVVVGPFNETWELAP